MSSRRQWSIPLGGSYRQVSLYLSLKWVWDLLIRNCSHRTPFPRDQWVKGIRKLHILSYMPDWSWTTVCATAMYLTESHSNAWKKHMRSLQWRHDGSMASQITSLAIVYSIVYSGADQRKHQSSAALAFVRGIHRWPAHEFPAQMASNVEHVSILWRHHGILNYLLRRSLQTAWGPSQ